MKSIHLSRIVLAGLLIVLCGITAQAQYENGSLIGTIHDSTGAVVANASVAVTNVGTGIITRVQSSASGDYEVPALRVGVYNVQAEASGFAPAEARNITISVAGRQRIDLTLRIGQANATTVEVSDVALQLETETSERGQTVSEYQTESLPLVSRNYSDLLALVTGSRQAPTAATTTAVTSLVRAGSYNVNGQRSMFNNYLLDGMDNNAYGESNQGFDNQIIQPPPDSIAQFQVVTNNESAEYGRSSGATINVASRSGTNSFHSTLYEFLRNTDLNAFGYIRAQSGTHTFPKPGFNRNQFGGDFGGPILKNRLFFFLDYEGFRQTLTPTVVLTVPTQNEINGILAVDVQDPFSPGTYYKKGTSILSSPDVSPISKQILGFWSQLPSQCVAAPGSPGINPTTGIDTNNCATNAPFTDNADKGNLRFDFQQNQSTSWFLRISDRKETGINYPTLPLPLDGQTNGRIKILDQQIALGYTRVFGTNKVLEARLGLSGTRAGKYTLSIGDNAIVIPGLPTDPTVAGGLPSTSVSGGFSSFGRQSTNPQWQNPSLLDPKISFAWAKGRHSLKFGYEYEHVWMEVQDSNPLFGSFTYGRGYSACPASAGAACANTAPAADTYWADFLFGTTNAYALATYFKAHLLDSMHNVYVQDDWKVTPRLTLNLGLRWEYGAPYSEEHNNLSNFVPETASMLTLTPGYTQTQFISPYRGGGVYGKTLVNPALGDFAPRVGFAFAVLPSMVVRGGFGTSYAHYTRAGSGDILAINAPNALFVSVTQPTSVTAAGYRTVDQGFPQDLATNFSPGTDNITYIPKDTKDSYVESYFLDVQKSLAKNILFDVAYIGNHGLRLQGFLNANQGNPALGIANPTNPNAGAGFVRPFSTWGGYVGTTWNYGDITEALNGFYSHFDALQVRYQQSSVAGLTLLNSFTWEHSLDNASASLEGNTPSPQNAYNLQGDYSQSDYNLPVANVTSLVYDLPVGHGKEFLGDANPLVNAIVGGWQLSAINTMQAGTPFNLTYSPNAANVVSPQISATYRGANEYRPNVVDGQKVTLCNSGHSCLKQRQTNGTIQYVNWAAFTLPATKDASGNLLSPFGNSSRNPGRTPAFYELDFNANKSFNTPIERLKVQFRTEIYNLFNHTNLYLPASGLSGTLSTAATLSSPTGGGAVSGTFEPRIIQFGLKVLY
jgi:Carboxypeptidase regulatory-like domain/TonB dependent receptor/TonB-dependent Receptor Plug Domain